MHEDGILGVEYTFSWGMFHKEAHESLILLDGAQCFWKQPYACS
jgi:hypothetical protein